jgi:hypothetical protein
MRTWKEPRAPYPSLQTMSILYIFCKAIGTKKKERRGNSKLYGLLLDQGVVLRGEDKKGKELNTLVSSFALGYQGQSILINS